MVGSKAGISVNRISKWMKERLARTLLVECFSFPRFANPLAYLGFLDFVCFLLLGITGVLLQMYYVPDLAGSYDSVAKINNEIAYGFEIRSIHYWLANFMIVLALAHFFYLYFTREYRLRNEILWVTGIVAGVLTILATYTGYVLVMNSRGMLAVNIGSGILGAVHTSLSDLLTGFSLTDTVVRMYALHVAVIPAIMVILFLMHFPKKLTVDASAIAATAGAVLVIGGLAPPELGSRFVQFSVPYLMIPEWYLTGIYALLRTGVQVLIAGVLLPLMFILTFVLIGFCDRGGRLGLKGRIVHVAIGITAMAHITLVTIWGFRAGEFFRSIKWVDDLPIDPFLFYGSLTVTAILVFVAVGLLFSQKSKLKAALMKIHQRVRHVSSFIFGAARSLLKQKTLPRLSLTGILAMFRHGPSERIVFLLMCMVLVFQIALYVHISYLQPLDLRGLRMTETGLSVLSLSLATYLYRAASSSSEHPKIAAAM